MSYQPTRRMFVKGILAACLLSVTRVGFAALTHLVAIRIWPSSTYTRITFESNMPLQYETLILHSPTRLVIDISDLYLNTVLQNIGTLVQRDDPFIKNVRVAQFNPDVVRLVIELKQPINPSLFNLQPFSEFKYRFVVDLYPAVLPKDDNSLTALLETFNKGNLRQEQSELKLPAKKKGPIVVMLDPGHGGEDPGAIGPRGTKEKVIVLQIARRLRLLLQKNKNIKVYMTRNEDIFIPLQVRVAKARSLHADLFISIHADAFTKQSAKGSSVYMLSTKGASSSAASFLASTQNESDKIGGVSHSGDRYLDHTLLDLVQTASMKNSDILGAQILKYIAKVNALHKRQVERAGFAVLKAPDIPSVLIETAFISNPNEEYKLRTANFQNQLANGIYRGILDYLKLRKI